MFKVIFRYVLSKAGILLLLVALLMFTPSVKEVIEILATFSPKIFSEEYLADLEKLLPDKGEPRKEIDRKRRELEDQLANKRHLLAEQDRVKCILPTCSLVLNSKRYYLTIEIGLLEQVIANSEGITDEWRACDKLKEYRMEYAQLQEIEEGLEARRCFYCPRTPEHERLLKRMDELKRNLIPLRQRLCEATRLIKLSIVTAMEKADAQFPGLTKDIQNLQNLKDDLFRKAYLVLPTALVTLFGIILLPIGAKCTAYFTIAPLASRSDGSRLFPDCGGALSLSTSEPLQNIELDATHELLIKHTQVLGTSNSAEIGNKSVLDWSMPLTSIAAGLYSLERVRTKSTTTVKLAVADGAAAGLYKLAVLTIPENAAVVLHPRCMVGVIQPINRPLCITRHWQLGYLSSWFSMRLRHIVLHGPVQLILRGHMGVAIEEVEGSSAQRRSFMLGYSANLSYGVIRSKPFFAYLKGDNELFDDRFFGGSGYYILEKIPKPSSAFGPARCFQAMIKTVFDLFGL